MKKYYYVTEIEYCVLCGVEHKRRDRVKEKPEVSIKFIEFACDEHFI